VVRIFKHFVPVQILVLVLSDALILVGSMYLGIALRFYGGDTGGLEEILPIFPKAIGYAIVMLATMTSMGLYMRDVAYGSPGYYLRLFISFAGGTGMMVLVFYALPGLFLGRGAFGFTVGFAIIGTVLARGVFVRVVNHDVLRKRIVVLGTGSRAAQVGEILRRENLNHKFQLVGYLALGSAHQAGFGSAHQEVPAGEILPSDAPLLATSIRYRVDELVVAVRDRRNGGLHMVELLECKLEGINVIDVSSFFERETGHVQLDSLNSSWMVYSDGFCRTSGRGLVKRIFDVFVSLILLALTLPVMLVTALAIMLESGMPILYRQTRVGECGEPFEVLKFRSMRVDAEMDGKPKWASAGDNRVTRIGAIIRLLRIDELPQIFNVLRGDMSFVGPRPERPYFVTELAREIPWYQSRHSVKPGITGWAQIRYPYGASVEDARRKLQYDLYYAKNHSLFLDLLILFQTVQVVLFRRGAR